MQPTTTPKNSTTVRSSNAVRLTRAALQAAFIVSEDLGTSIAERLFTSPRRHSRPQRERAVLASARSFTIPVTLRSPRWNGARTRVAAWRWGVGPTVLLVHGWEGRGSQLGALVEPLVAAGLSVVTFDAPAHGDSPGNRLYLTDHADAIADVATSIGPLHAIVAHSFGCAATLLAHARGGVDAARNVMIAPNVLIDDSLDRFARLVGLDDAERSLLEHQIVVASGVTVDSLSLARLAATRDAALLAIHDRDDREVPVRHAERLTQTWPSSRLLVTDGLGHRRILRDRIVLREVVEAVREGVPLPASDLVREVDRLVDALDGGP
ncbi:MAG: alpha/beta fold hydrolase [Deltaproteobacteria bacterium]|nr:alpha/beta fold hydrolase [Deltaproteobacteria bacterium]